MVHHNSPADGRNRNPHEGRVGSASRIDSRARLVACLLLSWLLAFATQAHAVTPKVAAGWLHSLSLKSDGTVWAWGDNSSGQLGDGSTTNRSTPTQVKGVGSTGFLTAAKAVAGGSNHSVALMADGTVRTWGANWSGQLGIPGDAQSNTPVVVSGAGGVGQLNGVTAVASTSFHTLALKSDGSVWSWGYNYNGQLGIGSSGSEASTGIPSQVVGAGGTGFIGSVAGIAAGGHHSVVLKTDGTVWAWGSNGGGQLGDGTTTDRSVPVQVKGQGGTGVLSGVVAIAAANGHTLALKADGSLWAWGGNNQGQLGNGNSVAFSSTPVRVKGVGGVGFLSGVQAIAGAGVSNSYALMQDGSVLGWGDGSMGGLGKDNTTNSNVPLVISGVAGARMISGGGFHALALQADGTVIAWGYNFFVGQVGSGTLYGVAEAGPVRGNLLNSVQSIATGAFHSIAARADGSVWAWGWNGDVGLLGPNSPPQDSGVPVQVAGISNARAVAAGFRHNVALKFDGTVWAWGSGENGRLGDGVPDYHTSATPLQVTGPGGNGTLSGVTAIAAGLESSFTLALKADGTVWAWGSNTNGQLGNGGTSDSSAPVQVKGPGGTGFLTGITAIAAGNTHAFALKADGTVWAWGMGTYGQLGSGGTADTSTPVQVKGPGGSGFLTGVRSIAAGDWTGVAVKLDGTALGWGNNYYGQLGNGGNRTGWSAPVQVKGAGGSGFFAGATGAASGWQHMAVVRSDGTVWSSGYNVEGELGNGGAPAESAVMVQAATASFAESMPAIQAVAAGAYHTIALTADGGVWSWGRNDYGQLGMGEFANYKRPVAVLMGGERFQLGTAVTPFSLYDQGGGYGGYTSESNTITIAGLDGPAAITVAGGEYSINGGEFTSAAGTVVNGQTVTTRLVRANSSLAFTSATLTIAGYSAVLTPSYDGTLLVAGSVHNLAVDYDYGYGWAWGNNDQGQFGSGTTVSSSLPVPTYFRDASRLAAGANHGLLVNYNNQVQAWGDNRQSQLGRSSVMNSSLAPINVPGLPPRILAVSAGLQHSVALDDAGNVWTWGTYKIGSAIYTDPTPTKVIGITNVIAIAAGYLHTVALRQDGTVWTWGEAPGGEDNSLAPRQVPGLFGVTAISAGAAYTLALSGGRVFAWGNSAYGVLAGGYGPPNDVGLGDIVGIAAGGTFALAINSQGRVYSWGLNNFNQLNRSTTETCGVFNCSSTPARITNIGKAWRVVAGAAHAIAIMADGVNSIVSWGNNARGQLGNHTLNFGEPFVHADWDPLGTVSPQLNPLQTVAVGCSSSSTALAAFLSGCDFGRVVIGVQSAQRQLILSNNTNAAVSVGQPSLSNTSDFSLPGSGGTCGQTLAPSQTCTIQVAFTPQSSGGFSTDLSIAIPAGTGSTSMRLTGNAEQPNQTPYGLSFSPQVGVAVNTLLSSAEVVVNGINIAAPISVSSGGKYSINDGAFTASPATVLNGDRVKVQLQSGAGSGAQTCATLTIGGASAQFCVTTIDTIPDAFAPPAQTGATPGSLATWVITVGGINTATPIRVSGGRYANLFVDSIYTTADGTVRNGDRIAVELATSPNGGVTTCATLTIGGISAQFCATTTSGAAMSLQPAALVYGRAEKGVSGPARTLTLTNSGTQAMSSLLFSLSGDFSRIGGSCGTTLAAGASCTVVIRFRPAGLGPRADTFGISSNAPGSPHSVPLSGTGLALNDLIVDYDATYGLWAWRNNSAWSQLSTLSSDSLTRANLRNSGSDDLVADFGPRNGLWAWNTALPWTQINGLSPRSVIRADLDNNGTDELVADFGPGYGLWVLRNNSVWAQLHTLPAQSMVRADLDGNGIDDVVVDFGAGRGLWVWSNNSTWSQLSPNPARSMLRADLDGSGRDDLVVDFGVGIGISVWTNNTAWVPLSANSAQAMLRADLDNNGQDDLVVDFGAGTGIRVWNNNSAWTQLSAQAAQSMVRADLDGNGQDDLVIDFGPATGMRVWSNNAAWVNLAPPSSLPQSGIATKRMAPAAIDPQ